MFSYFHVTNDDLNQRLSPRMDPLSGLIEFPVPGEGDFKKYNIPILIDPDDEEIQSQKVVREEEQKSTDLHQREYWMPDKLCKVCYSCGEAFTMYRRRHHCRMCGQVFCNPCSSHYIDSYVNGNPTPVRSCRLCFEQIGGRFDSKLTPRRKRIMEPPPTRIRSNDNDQRPQTSYKSIHQILIKSDSNSSSDRMSFQKSSSTNIMTVSEEHIDTYHEQRKDSLSMRNIHMSDIQNRASQHLESVVQLLVKRCPEIPKLEQQIWEGVIVDLVREVISNVDPDVRAGDSMDIRQYVKLKVIPGGKPEESAFISGVVFRKNISHRSMLQSKSRPRILLLGGGIDFERSDTPRLSALDTLLEQENKYLEILVEKIMSLKPDLILVGKSVARRAQELLVAYKVAVIQNIKPNLLDRLSRMTGATTLPSTDHMIQQYGEQCLGSCEEYWLRHVDDDPERCEHVIRDRRKTVRASMNPGSTYVYLEGCPSELGCSLVLRGADRLQLKAIKSIVGFSIMVAYHLRLECCYYHDRYASLPTTPDVQNKGDPYGIDSDDEATVTPSENPSDESNTAASTPATEAIPKDLFDRSYRLLLSSSLDVDVGVPHWEELRGLRLKHRIPTTKFSPMDHQSILITSLALIDSNAPNSHPLQRTRAEVKAMRYYSPHDLTLGLFLVDSCFHLNGRRDSLVDHTLSFVHRPGRLDVTITEDSFIHEHQYSFDETASNTSMSSRFINQNNHLISSNNNSNNNNHNTTTPLNTINTGYGITSQQIHSQSIPIYLSSYCKICKSIVTPQIRISEETWKMSFGKFLEISFYCRSSTCRNPACGHYLRDDMILKFACDGYCASMEFIPTHPCSLHIRPSMPFPETFHAENNIIFMKELTELCSYLIDRFSHAALELEKEAFEILSGCSPDLLESILAQLRTLQSEFLLTASGLTEDAFKVEENLRTPNILTSSDEYSIPSTLGKKSKRGFLIADKKIRYKTGEYSAYLASLGPSPISIDRQDSALSSYVHPFSTQVSLSSIEEHEEYQSSTPLTIDTTPRPSDRAGGVRSSVHLEPNEEEDSNEEGEEGRGGEDDAVDYKFPMSYKRELYLRACNWNETLHSLYRRIDDYQSQGQGLGLAAVAAAVAADAYSAVMNVGRDEYTQWAVAPPFEPTVSINGLNETNGSNNQINPNNNIINNNNNEVRNNTLRELASESTSSNEELVAASVAALGGWHSVDSSENSPMTLAREARLSEELDKEEISKAILAPGSGSKYESGTSSEVLIDKLMESENVHIKPCLSEEIGSSLATSSTSLSDLEPSSSSSVVNMSDNNVLDNQASVAFLTSEEYSQEVSDENMQLSHQHQSHLFVTTASNQVSNSASVSLLQNSNKTPNSTSTGTPTSQTDEIVSRTQRFPSVSEPVEKDKKKGNRLTKALARLLGKDSENNKYSVPLGSLSMGRLGLKPGRKGRIVPVFDDELATIIAYSLSSDEYYLKVREVSEEPEGSVDMDDDEGSVADVDIHMADKAMSSTHSHLDEDHIFTEAPHPTNDTKEKDGTAETEATGRDPLQESTSDSSSTTRKGSMDIPPDFIDVAETNPESADTTTSLTTEEVNSIQNILSIDGKDAMTTGYESKREGNEETNRGSASLNSPLHNSPFGFFGSSDVQTKEEVGKEFNFTSLSSKSSEIFKEKPDLINQPRDDKTLDPNVSNSGTNLPIAVSVALPRQKVVEEVWAVAPVGESTPTIIHPLSESFTDTMTTKPSPLLSASQSAIQRRQDLQSENQSSSHPSATELSSTVIQDGRERGLAPNIDATSKTQGLSMTGIALSDPGGAHLGKTGSDPVNTGVGGATTAFGMNERHMLSQSKSHVKHRFIDVDEKGNILCKFLCHTFYATQFQAVRAAYLGDDDDEGYIRSLSASCRWNAQGGKSGATFSRSQDGRLIMKQISRTELQMFLDFAPAYFEYMSKAYYHKLPSLLCKILGVYQVGYHNRSNGKKVMEQVVVMENLFYERQISLVFDLKGNTRRANVSTLNGEPILDFDQALLKRRDARREAALKLSQEETSLSLRKTSDEHQESVVEAEPISDDSSPTIVVDATPYPPIAMELCTIAPSGYGHSKKISNVPEIRSPLVLLDDNLLSLTNGMPFPLRHKAKVFFQKAVTNDTLFLSIINVVDYSIVVGFDETNHEIVVGIIDYMRQYDMIKRMESMGKSVGMMVGKDEPTVIPPLQYRKRFQAAMEKYFMTVPDKWVSYDV